MFAIGFTLVAGGMAVLRSIMFMPLLGNLRPQPTARSGDLGSGE
jgi:hypothetical protein